MITLRFTSISLHPSNAHIVLSKCVTNVIESLSICPRHPLETNQQFVINSNLRSKTLKTWKETCKSIRACKETFKSLQIALPILVFDSLQANVIIRHFNAEDTISISNHCCRLWIQTSKTV